MKKRKRFYSGVKWKDYDGALHRVGDCFEIQGKQVYNHYVNGKNIGFISQKELDQKANDGILKNQ